MSILERYLAKTVIGGTLLVLLVLVALGVFFDFLGEVARVGEGAYGIREAMEYVLLSSPQMAWEMFPVAALIGTLMALGGIAAGSEIVAMRAAGISLLQIARATVVGALSLAVVCFALGDFIAPPAEQYAQARRALALYGELSQAGREGVWARDGDSYVNVRNLGDARRVDGIFIFEFGDGNRLERSTQATAARFGPDGWALENVEATTIAPDGTATTASHEMLAWETQLSPDLLNLFVVDPGSLSALGLREYVDYLVRNGLDARRYQHAFWAKLVAPVSVLVMVLLALPFVAGSQRTGSVGQRLMIGLLIGVGFFMINRVLGFSGEVFALDPVFVAWLPTAVLAAAALVTLARMR